jgi:predicted phosphate transport protein (TIGR00153 family)
LSDLAKWFEKRREDKALATVQHHLALTTTIVEELEKAMTAATLGNDEQKLKYIETVASGEREADRLRRRVMDEVSRGELDPTSRQDVMELVKRVDMVADWSRESTRVLGALPMQHVPQTIKQSLLEMVSSIKECVRLVQACVDKMFTKPKEALRAADAVEREEEKVDDIHEKARILLVKEDLQGAGTAVLISQLFEAIEMIADSCEDACDQVRIIMVRR